MNIEEELKNYTKYLIDKKYIPTGKREDGVVSIEFIIKNYLDIKTRLYSDDLIKIVHDLNTKFKGEIIFCGSLGLAINNCLNREVHDIDCLLLNKYDNQLEKWFKFNNGGSFDFQLDGEIVQVEKFKYNDIAIDLFYHDKVKETKFTTVDFHGINIKVESPFGAIKAKREYAKLQQLTTKDKHVKDLEYIESLMK